MISTVRTRVLLVASRVRENQIPSLWYPLNALFAINPLTPSLPLFSTGPAYLKWRKGVVRLHRSAALLACSRGWGWGVGAGRVGEVLQLAGNRERHLLHRTGWQSLSSVFFCPHSVWLPLIAAAAAAAPLPPGQGPGLVLLPDPGSRAGLATVPAVV